jgi:hypothetical protein
MTIADRRRGSKMRYLRYLTVLGILMLPTAYSEAQVAVGIRVGPGYVGPAPVCTYGYFSYYPYACAPYGYYSPRWFVGGVFIGAGPWYRGFYGRGFGPYWRGGSGYYGRGYYRPGAYGHRSGGYGYGRGYGYSGGYARGSYGGGYAHGSVGGGFHGGGHR